MVPLKPCSTRSPPHPPPDEAAAADGVDGCGCGGGGAPAPAPAPPLDNRVGPLVAGAIAAPRDSPSCSSSPASSSYSAALGSRKHPLRRGVRLRSRRPLLCASRGGGERISDDAIHGLALPLGMSFAAVLAQVLDKMNVSGERLPVDRLSKICVSAVKESVTNVYGDKFDSFIGNFEKSFGSTLRTLHLINETNMSKLENASCSSSTHESSQTQAILGSVYPTAITEQFHENPSPSSLNNQLILHHQSDHQQLVQISQSSSRPEFKQQMLSTFERSVQEQARSNNLKEFEIGLTLKKLQLKQSQLALSLSSHVLEKIKITMGIVKASFREEKLRNQMQDVRVAELLKRFIDLLVTGLFVMSGCFAYGTYIYSYRRITEVTSACASISMESKSWWMPKQMASFNSGWLFIRCHLVALSRMSFGILMILAVAWLIFQRSAMSGSSMNITFNIMLLGIFCGFSGKLCVDALGGDGYCWFMFWETFCLLHFLGSEFPSAFYGILHGPISASRAAEIIRPPYWIRRYAFYSILLLILPVSAGLLPFASIHDWKEHFTEKLKFMAVGGNDEL